MVGNGKHWFKNNKFGLRCVVLTELKRRSLHFKMPLIKKPNCLGSFIIDGRNCGGDALFSCGVSCFVNGSDGCCGSRLSWLHDHGSWPGLCAACPGRMRP